MHSPRESRGHCASKNIGAPYGEKFCLRCSPRPVCSESSLILPEEPESFLENFDEKYCADFFTFDIFGSILVLLKNGLYCVKAFLSVVA